MEVTSGQLPLNDAVLAPLDAERLRALIAAASDAFFDVDVSAKTIWWSPGIALILGHDASTVGPRLEDWQRLLHPDDAPAILARGGQLLPDGTTWSDEFRMRRADGSYAPVRARAFVIRDASGSPVHVVGALTDLASVRELEDELREANERLRIQIARERQERVRAELLIRASTAGVLFEWWLDEDRIAWSPNVEAVLGYAATDLLSPADVGRRAPDIAAQVDEMRRRIGAGTSAWSRQFAWRLPSGESVELEAQSYVLRSDEGRPERVIGSMRRVPERPPVAIADLTPRQRQVLALVRLGNTNKEIATALGITEQAAKVQVSKLIRKFGVANRVALAIAGRSYAAL